MSNEKQSNGETISLERWGMRLSLTFLGVDAVSDYAKSDIEKILADAFGELGCNLAGDGYVDWTPQQEGLLATGEER